MNLDNFTLQQKFKLRDALKMLCDLGVGAEKFRPDWELHVVECELERMEGKDAV